ncbi:MAG: DUF1501 domain-containing protein [Wenyingzhuangia sp.]|uniref:DUF1501 domain-containing protein n=1 Tax=Wenyingzhuangia sp. TaxID=1964193 RepID=UPI0032190756
MKRRQFLQQSALASSMVFVPNFIKATEQLSPSTLNTKKLVIIQLSGGNDGLNTVVPYTNDIYYKKRPKIAIKPTEVIKLNDTMGLHHNMKSLQKIYDKGYLGILNNVGYPNPNRSHFRSTDIWHTASQSNEYLTSGWVGRYMEHLGGKPYTALEIADSLSLMLKGGSTNGIATTNAKLLNRNMNTPYFKKILQHQTDAHLSEHNLGYLYKTMIASKSSAKYIYEKSKTAPSTKTYPNNPFGKQLKTTAGFINSRLDTKVYYLSMGGFDTHANQNMAQSRLLQLYAEGMEVFVKDLEDNGTFDDVLIMTFSEFGRRVRENASKGTDHGAANNVFIIGKNLKKTGFYNEGPDLNNLDANKDLKYSIDFRSIYTSLLQNWLGVEAKPILNSTFTPLDFI